MYILEFSKRETNEKVSFELDTTYRTIERIQKRTGKSIEFHIKNAVDAFILEKVELLADGLKDQALRKELIDNTLENVAPVKINAHCQLFLMELFTDGMTEEEKEAYFPKNLIEPIVK